MVYDRTSAVPLCYNWIFVNLLYIAQIHSSLGMTALALLLTSEVDVGLLVV